MGTFTLKGLSSILLYLRLKTISCNRDGSNLFELFRVLLWEEVVVLKRTVCFGFCGDLTARSPRIRLASWISFGIMVTRLAWMAQRLVSSNSPTRYASEASCRASTAAC